MEYLFKCWERIKERIKETEQILLLLDYDGTLTPIVERSDKAIISEEMKELLKSLSQRCKLAIISGRTLKDIKKLVGLKGIIYAGNHGLEIEGPRIRFKSPISIRSRIIIKQIREDLKKRFSTIGGLFVEDKGLTLSVHYRLVDRKQIHLVEIIFNEITKSYLKRKRIRITSGKKVFEVRPPVNWDKGKAV